VTTDIIKITLSSPQDVIAAVPHLLGFHPADSLVVVATNSHRLVGAFRYDLPGADAKGIRYVTRNLLRSLECHQADEVVLVGYGLPVQAWPMLAAAVAELEDLLTISEALVVTGSRFWPMLCQGCCPPEGIEIDSAATVAAAQLTAAGSAPLASREALADMIAPQDGAAARAMRRAVVRASMQLPRAGREGPDARHVARLRELLAMPVPLADEDAGALILLLASIRLRDEAWVLTDAGDPVTQVEFWADITRRAPPRLAAPAASLLAYAAACLAGDGALAREAVGRALDANPQYSMARRIEQMLDAGIPAPDCRLRLTPEDLPPVAATPATRQAGS
jgi:hypothetical protein